MEHELNKKRCNSSKKLMINIFKKLILIFLFCFYLIGESVLVAQNVKSIHGLVTDMYGESVPGVSVVVKGTTIGTVTDLSGEYFINESTLKSR